MPTRRIILAGMSYTIDEENADEIELEVVNPIPDPPPEELRGEPMGWTKEGPKPRGWREDGNYDNEREKGDPGPFDGRWERD